MKKTIILTGATGVVGRSLKGFLRKKKLNLVLLDRSKLKNSKEILNRKKFVFGKKKDKIYIIKKDEN